MMVVCFERNYTMLIHWGSKIIKFNRQALEQRISATPLPNWLIKNIVPCSCCLRKVLCGKFLSHNLAINFLRTSVRGVFMAFQCHLILYSYFCWNLSVFQELYVALHVLKNAEIHINIDLTQKAMKQIKKRKTKQLKLQSLHANSIVFLIMTCC